MEYYGSFEEDCAPDPRKDQQWCRRQRERYGVQEQQKRSQYDEESSPDYDPWSGSYY